MSIQFGVGTLKILENRGIDSVIADISASTTTMTATNNRNVMIDGITAIFSAQVVSLTSLLSTGLGATGSGLLYYLYIPAGQTTTASVGMALVGANINTATDIPTAICPLFKFSFGTAANAITTLEMYSGGSATRTIAKVQNVSINVSYESAQMRGGGDIFPVDTKFFDGKAEGSFEFAEATATQNLIWGGIYASAGASSGTHTLSGASRPQPVSLVFQNVTDGVTSTYRLMKAYISQASHDFGRTDYMQPSYNFVTQANILGDVLKFEG